MSLVLLCWVSLMGSGAQHGHGDWWEPGPSLNAFEGFIERVCVAEGEHTRNLILELTGPSQTELSLSSVSESDTHRKTNHGPKTNYTSGLRVWVQHLVRSRWNSAAVCEGTSANSSVSWSAALGTQIWPKFGCSSLPTSLLRPLLNIIVRYKEKHQECY